MNNPRFLVAKYVADPRRMEPVNIGIVLWTPHRVRARFLDAADVSVNDTATYARWVNYWTGITTEETFDLPRGGSVALRDPVFVDALRETQKGNYLLFDGGETLGRVPVRQVDEVVDQLFADLVRPSRRSDSDTRDSLDDICESIFDDTGLSERDDFLHPVSPTVKIKKTERPLAFDYGLGSKDRYAALFRKVRVRSQLNVDGSSFVCEWALKKRLVETEGCITLLYAGERELENPNVASALHQLEGFSTVVNVADRDRATESIATVGSKF